MPFYTIRRLIGLAFLSGCSVNAFSDAPDNDIDWPATGYEEVLVLAQKREQNLQEVPISISAFSHNDLAQLSIGAAPELAFHVPNMQFSGAFGDAQPIFAIRGVATADFNANQTSSIGVYIDEAYSGAVFTHGMHFFDLAQVEVLRGPQGTLYGKNTTGGSINIASVNPVLDNSNNNDSDAYLAVELGNYNRTRFEAAADATLVPDVLAARVAVFALQHDGYIDNEIGDDLNAADDWAGRLSLLWRINEHAEATIKYTTGKRDGRATTPRSEGRLGTDNGLVDFSGYQRGGLDFHESEIDFVGDAELDFDSLTMRAEIQLNNSDIISISSWQKSDYSMALDADGSPFSQDHNDVLAKSEAFSQDLRWVSDDDAVFSYILGLYLGKESLDSATAYRLLESPNIFLLEPSTEPLGVLLNQYGKVTTTMEIERRSAAFYSQLRWQLATEWGIDVGLRYTRDKDKMLYANVSRHDYDGLPIGSWVPGNITEGTTNIDSPFLPPGTRSPTDPGTYTSGDFTADSIPGFSETQHEWTGKLGSDYQLSDATLVYASFSRGYRSGNFFGGLFYLDQGKENLYADPEYVNAYEFGIKHQLADAKMTVNSAMFYYDYKDMQFVHIVGLTPVMENAGGASIRGIEIDVQYALNQALKLRLGLGWLDTEYDDLRLTDESTGDLVDLSGNQLISAPEWNLSAGVDYRWALSSGASVIASLDGNYQSEQYYSAYNELAGYDKVKQNTYRVYNTQVRYQRGEQWLVAVWGKNIFDEEYDSYALGLVGAIGLDFYNRGTPRTVGLSVRYSF